MTMAVVEQSDHWSLRSCQYMGEISALSFLNFPHRLSSLPYLLAGSGSQLLVYDLELGKMVGSFFVFQGIRVHGISCCDFLHSRTKTMAVFGERRVKLFSLCPDDKQTQVGLDLTMLQCLPKFSSWVLDVCFFKEANPCLAIGCSDNSVSIWDISKSSIVLQVQSPERSLLYSMRLWGDSLEALRIASGTIYNEIIIWKVIPQNVPVTHSLHHQDQIFKAVHTCKLVGHEGSIFRLAWSTDGSKLVSVSDDRCARIWEVSYETEESDKPRGSVVLFGHSARVWDCSIFDTLIVTAGEDCTCRIWDFDGKQLQVIKEHLGRGIWRCLYDPNLSLIITAGFDSSIKVHQLDNTSLPRSLRGQFDANDSDRTSICMIRIPSSSDHVKLMDSKSEYVRCLRFTREDSLYVATNHGYLYHAKLSDTGDASWTKIFQVSEKTPIVCMDILSKTFNPSCGDEDWIAVGDGKGNMTVVRVIHEACSPNVGVMFTWSAGKERQLLGTHWCKPLGYSYIFTADPKGTLKLWRLCDLFQSFPHNTDSFDPSLVAEFTSSFGMRIMCLDASLEDEVLVCGDIRGNLVLFPFSKSILVATGVASNVNICASKYFKGAHGISSVTSVSVAGLNSFQTEICSTGGDGCICFLEYDRVVKHLEFTGMKQVKELSLIQSVSSDTNSACQSAQYAAGFTSVDFLIWNLKSETKILQIPCGGWRRPHSYYIGDLPEIKNCFAFVKDEVIHIHRHWVPDGCRKTYPQNLHMQFHGREMHSLCFITNELLPGTNGPLSSEPSWIATGCEDGTVRLTRYTPGFENWTESKLLGEHVGGSAVRSICCVSKMHMISAYEANIPDGGAVENDSAQDTEYPCLLISVGAKRVLTSWLLRNRKLCEMKESLADGQHCDTGNGSSSEVSSSMSFQWLSTDMPPKYSNTNKSMETTGKIIGGAANKSSTNGNEVREDREMQLKSRPRDKCEDDWRYLAVTAFLVKCVGSRLTVCFVVVACSDATLVLRALVLPIRLWFDVALLVPLSSPVLTLQHVVTPSFPPSTENIHDGSAYIVISGATDGSIAFWDLTGSVKAFMQRVSILQVEKFIDCQIRPRTGRGSQGGRWWRSLGSSVSKNRSVKSFTERSGVGNNHITQDTLSMENGSVSSKTAASQDIHGPSHTESHIDDSLSEIFEISPMHVLENIHQSGVNCLHISDTKGCQSSDGGFLYNVLSGGDDQALHCVRFALIVAGHGADLCTLKSRDSIAEKSFPNSYGIKNKSYSIQVLNHDEVLSAHTSAIKGIWTDGFWVFSTGLDQRIRCWSLDKQAKLTEHAHVIISVPEPEALDARVCGRGLYQIAVVGRGMQMAEFSAPGDLN